MVTSTINLFCNRWADVQRKIGVRIERRDTVTDYLLHFEHPTPACNICGLLATYSHALPMETPISKFNAGVRDDEAVSCLG